MNFEPGPITSQAISQQLQIRSNVDHEILNLASIRPCISRP